MGSIDRGIALATSAALQSEGKQFRVGAALLNKKEVIRTGRNSYKTHPKSKTRFCQIHAEFDCLIGLSPGDCSGASIFVVRIRRNGTIGMAKPCNWCRELIEKMGIRKIFYTNALGETVWEKVNAY